MPSWVHAEVCAVDEQVKHTLATLALERALSLAHAHPTTAGGADGRITTLDRADRQTATVTTSGASFKLELDLSAVAVEPLLRVIALAEPLPEGRRAPRLLALLRLASTVAALRRGLLPRSDEGWEAVRAWICEVCDPSAGLAAGGARTSGFAFFKLGRQKERGEALSSVAQRCETVEI